MSVTVYEHERGLVYQRGRLVRVLEPGRYWTPPGRVITRIDVRERIRTVAGQDVLSADGIGLRVSVAARYRVADPRLAVTATEDYEGSLYLRLQLALRDLVAALPMDELLAARAQLSADLFAAAVEPAEQLGLRLLAADVKDLMLPADVRAWYLRPVEARKEGQAALERARGETAALRSLANAARMLADNPALGTLRLLQHLDAAPGATFVVGVNPDGSARG